MDVPEESEVAALQPSFWQELNEDFTPAISMVPFTRKGVVVQLLIIDLVPPERKIFIKLLSVGERLRAEISD